MSRRRRPDLFALVWLWLGILATAYITLGIVAVLAETSGGN